MDESLYKKNPVVGILVDGELKSLDYKILHKAVVEEVKLFSPLGKRIYRHSICLLLSYAAAFLYPNRHLEIGHSLGDGFYFQFTDHETTEEDVKAFAEGVTLDDGYETMPAELEILKSDDISEIALTIHEGKFHQVKRMFESVGKKVVYLKRLSMGKLKLDEGLALGEYRELTEEEVKMIEER